MNRRRIHDILMILICIATLVVLTERCVQASTEQNDPTYLDLNKWTDLGSASGDYYTAVYGSKPILFEINRSECNDYVTFSIFSDADYENNIFSGICSGSESRIRVFSQNSDKYYFMQTAGLISGCDPVIPSNMIVYLGEHELSLGNEYSVEANYYNPIFYYLQINEGEKYKVNFTAEEPNTDLEFEFFYSDAGDVSENYENIILYNNGYFTAKKTALTLVSVRSYQLGTHNFDFEINQVTQQPEDDYMREFMIVTISVVAVSFLLVAFYRYRKQGKVF